MTEPAVCPVPVDRPHPLLSPVGIAELAAQQPRKVRWPNGVDAWLFTSFADVRFVLSDKRFTALKNGDAPALRTTGDAIISVDLPGNINTKDGEEHLRLRRPLARGFLVKRMNELRPHIQQLVDEHLDAMEQQGSPADLVQALCLPVPSLVIADLLGVPHDHKDLFQRTAQAMFGISSSRQEFEKHATELAGVLSQVIAQKKATGTTDDLIGVLANDADTDLDMMELLTLCIALLAAGHETTANFLGIFVLNLFERPDQLELLRQRPDRVDVAVEELMRYSLGQVAGSVIRRATEDVMVGDTLVREGDWVGGSMFANLDPALCPNASELDLARETVSHIGFGFGPHQCLGANLARVELQIMLRSLLLRFPKLRPAKPITEMTFHDDMITYGAAEIPVVW